MGCVGGGNGAPPPFFTLVAGRAIAHVAGMQPKMEEKTFAVPCATNSILDLWLPPLMPSATTADKRDSMPPSKAMAKAGRSRFFIVSKSNRGIVGAGKEDGMFPNRLPMVSTGRCRPIAAIVVTRMAISEPGILCVTFGQRTITMIVTRESRTAYPFAEDICTA